MSEFQKVVKYFAIAFAIFLSVSIIGGIVTGVLALTGVFSGGGSMEIISINKSFDDIKSITIDHGVGTLTVKEGSGAKVEVVGENVSDRIEVERNFSGNLSIHYKGNFFNWFNFKTLDSSKSRLTVYLPSGFIAENVEINAGVGNVNIEYLKAEKFDVDGGAGNLSGDNIVAGKVKIEGGVGDVRFKNVDFTDADINSGVGNITIEGYLTGRNSINCGVGEVDLNLRGTTDDYNIDVNKGLGNIYINGDKYSDVNWNNRNATNELNIDGGVGNISITFR